MSVDTRPLRQWLKASQDSNAMIVDLMAYRYDLDGALSAGQTSLVWTSVQKLLLGSVRLFLAERGVELPWFEDAIDRDIQAVRTLERLNPAVADRVWEVWTRPAPDAADLDAELDRAMTLMSEQLGAPFAASREHAVIRWARDTRVLRIVAKEFGLAQADNWYVSDSTVSSPDLDWYGEVLKSLEG